jgi:peptidoglycan hydrolase CwlO-like protein
LRRIIVQKDQIAELESKQQGLSEEREKIVSDQKRLRDNMESLKGGAEQKALLLRYTRQLDEQENRLEEIQKQIEQLKSPATAAQAALDKTIEDLAFDVKL